MPNLPVHIELAHRAARRLAHPVLADNLGYFLLGSTSPDIRVITRRSREEYHFVPLDFHKVGAGIEGMFRSHPGLASAGSHEPATQAFIAGYMTHLVVDEMWITGMYRSYFGNKEVFEDQVVGNVMDRALQLELDRRAWDAAGANRPSLESACDGVELDFISRETLHEWRLWVLGTLERGFSWERLRFMARRIAAGREDHPAHQVADEFLQSVPRGLRRLFDSVPDQRVTDLQGRTVDELVRVVGDYLR